MSAIDIQYLHTISHKLDRFKKKSQNLYNFRCPYCGDSQKKKTKARGFVYRVKNDMFYKCHNCGKGTTVGKLIEYLDVQLYKKYVGHLLPNHEELHSLHLLVILIRC